MHSNSGLYLYVNEAAIFPYGLGLKSSYNCGVFMYSIIVLGRGLLLFSDCIWETR